MSGFHVFLRLTPHLKIVLCAIFLRPQKNALSFPDFCQKACLPHPAVVDLSSDDDAAASSDINVDFLSILLAPGFQLVSIQPQLCGYMLVPFDPVGQHMIRQRILFKWLTYGWCLGKISA